MKKAISISVDFDNSIGGQVQIIVLGPGTHLNYQLTNDETWNIEIDPALYTIQAHGTSGGTLKLVLSQSGSILVNRLCPPVHLFIIDNFTVS